MWLTIFLAMLIPGMLLGTFWGKKDLTLLLATPLSLLLYVLIAICTHYLEVSKWLIYIYLAVGLLLLFISISTTDARHHLVSVLTQLKEFLPILTVVWIYHYFTGAFVDHGFDVFQHMIFVQKALIHMVENEGEIKFKLATGNFSYLFHNIAASFQYIFNVKTQQVIEITAIAYSTLWTLSVYYFCKVILRMSGVPGRSLIFVSYLAVFFYWAAFGINNFSFPRYYIGGPVILNYGVYLAALILFVDQLTNKFTISKLLVLCVLLSLATLLHPQELFLFIAYVLALAAAIVGFRILGITDSKDIPANNRNTFLALMGLLSIVLAIVLAIYFLPKYTFDPIPLRNLGLFSLKLIDWNVLRPNHQFYNVIGLWGLYVCCLVVLNITQFRNRVLLLTSLLVPIVTVFNPFFAEAYMRIAYPQVLWRLLFAMQLPIVAAFLVFLTISQVQRCEWKFKAIRLAMLIPLFGLLIVFGIGPINNSMAKSPSLLVSPLENSYRHWQDLIEFLQARPIQEKILTDPSTGYLVRALTSHKNQGFKFYRNNFREFNFKSYADDPFKKYSNWLLIINKRDGEINNRFKKPYHVYSDIMLTAKYYDDKLLSYVESNPEIFKRIWGENDIAVYRIKY